MDDFDELLNIHTVLEHETGGLELKPFYAFRFNILRPCSAVKQSEWHEALLRYGIPIEYTNDYWVKVPAMPARQAGGSGLEPRGSVTMSYCASHIYLCDKGAPERLIKFRQGPGGERRWPPNEIFFRRHRKIYVMGGGGIAEDF